MNQSQMIIRRLTQGSILLVTVGSAVAQESAVSIPFTVANDDKTRVSRTLAVEHDAAPVLSPPGVSVEIDAHYAATAPGPTVLHRDVRIVNSSQPADAIAVMGTLTQQIETVNAGPPDFDPQTWQSAQRADRNLRAAFRCESTGDPLAQPFVDANTSLYGIAEATLDNCNSAFYRYTFVMPPGFANARINGSLNVDDQGVLFLNGNRITGLMNNAFCEPAGGPDDFCYEWQDAGFDPADVNNVPILTWPTLDTLDRALDTILVPGVNELVIGVVGNARYEKPTGVEFAVVLMFETTQGLPGDLDGDCAVGLSDLSQLLAHFGVASGATFGDGDVDQDGDVDLSDLSALLTQFGSICS